MALKKLNAKFCETAKAGEGDKHVTYRDEVVEWLEFRVSTGGIKSWILRYRCKDGQRGKDGERLKRALTMGRFPEMELADARDLARKHKVEIAEGGDPAGKVQARKEALSFAELSQKWEASSTGGGRKGARSLADDKSMLRRHIIPCIGSVKAGEVTRSKVSDLLDAVAAVGDARFEKKLPASKRRRKSQDVPVLTKVRKLSHRPARIFELVRRIFNWAVERGDLAANPIEGMPSPISKSDEIAMSRERALSGDEMRTLWGALDATPVERRKLDKGAPTGTRIVGDDELSMTRATALAMQLSLTTGQRIGEVAGIEKAELDLNQTAPLWTIPRERTKNGKPHQVPLSPLAAKLLNEAIALNDAAVGFVFPSYDGTRAISSEATAKALQRSRTALAIENFRVHDLRRTAATQMAELGVNPFTISLILNHISVTQSSVTARYNRHSYLNEKREALNAWGAHLERIIAGKEVDHNVVILGALREVVTAK